MANPCSGVLARRMSVIYALCFSGTVYDVYHHSLWQLGVGVRMHVIHQDVMAILVTKVAFFVVADITTSTFVCENGHLKVVIAVLVFGKVAD